MGQRSSEVAETVLRVGFDFLEGNIMFQFGLQVPCTSGQAHVANLLAERKQATWRTQPSWARQHDCGEAT